MSDPKDDTETGIDRRTVLKSAAAASVAGFVGVPTFSGSAVADDVAGHPISDYDLHGIDHKSDPNKLVTVDSEDLVPGGGPTTVDATALSTNVDVNTVAAHPLEEGGVRYFYSTDLSTDRAFKVHPDNGTVQHFGDVNSILGGIAGSAIILDGNGDPHWYGITHGGFTPSSTLFEIDLNDGSTTEKGRLHVYDGEERTDITATHLGMGVNFLTDELWGVIGDPEDETNSQVFKVVDVETGEIEIVDSEAMTGGRSVGAALSPCASVMFAVRTGNDLYGYDVESGDEYSYGSLEYASENTLDFDSLAVPYGFECQECTECTDSGSLVKYEFECVETECVEEDEDGECDEWECVNHDFTPEGESHDGIWYDVNAEDPNYDDKEGEENEPISVTFETEYCELDAYVKAGPEEDWVDVTIADGKATVDISDDERFEHPKNGKKYAISYVEFYCPQEE